MVKKRSSKDYERGSIEEAQAYYRDELGIADGWSPIDPEELKRFRAQQAKKKAQESQYYNEEGGALSNIKNAPEDAPSNRSYSTLVRPNVLHKFASYNTIFTLSGITEREIRDHSFLKNAPHDIIARTGGIGNPNLTSANVVKRTGDKDAIDRLVQDNYNKFVEDYRDSISILERGHDIFFENVNMLSTVGPNAERNLANFTKMEFQLHEPYGITFIEKVRAATAINGYEDYQDAPLLLTIEFKGFDEQGRQLTGEGIVRKIPILIVRVDFDVNEGGAKYDITAVPYTDLAFDDRFKFPRTSLSVTANNAREWALKVEKRIKDSMEEEKKENLREVIDEYRFVVSDDVAKIGGGYKKTVKSINSAIALDTSLLSTDLEPGPANKTIKIDSANGKAETNTSLVKYFEDAVRETYGYQRLANDFWTTYLERAGAIPEGGKKMSDAQLSELVNSPNFQKTLLENQYVDWFKIKTTVHTHTKDFDNITKMHRKTVIFKAVPYKVHILKLIKPGVSIRNLDFSKLVRKEYNYIYTGDNVDVQNLRINYKSAYYMRNVYDAKANEGIFSTLSDVYQKVFGAEKYPEPTKQIRQYPSIKKNRSTIDTPAGEGQRAQEFFDYLTNPEADMIRVEMDILGDPAYICQDMYVPLGERGNNKVFVKGDYDSLLESFNADQYNPLVLIRYRLPDDISDKDGLMFSDKNKYRDEDLFFNGVYQVVKVESKFDNGQFIQTLTCVRMNNQQGEGAPAVLAAAASKDSPIKNKSVAQIKAEKEKEIKEAAIKQAEKEFNDIVNDTVY